MQGGNYAPFRSRCDIYQDCQTPSRSKKLIVPKYKNTTANATYPVDGTTGKSTIPQGANISPPILNTFAADGTIDLTTCNEVGRQMALAHRQWHGRYAFNDGTVAYPNVPCTSPAVNYRDYQASAPTKKYLVKSIAYSGNFTYHWKQKFTVGGTLYEATIDYTVLRTYYQTITVDKYSGLRFLSGWVDTKTISATLKGGIFTDPGTGAKSYDGTTYTSTNYTNIFDNVPANTTIGYVGSMAVFEMFAASGQWDDYAKTLDMVSSLFNVTYFNGSQPFNTLYANPTTTLAEMVSAIEQVMVDSPDYLTPDTTPASPPDTNTATATLSTVGLTLEVTASMANHSTDAYGADNTIAESGSLTIDVKLTLSSLNDQDPTNPNSPVYDANQNLLATWPLNDRVLFPLSNAPWNGVCVYVTRNEVGSAASPDGYETYPYTDGNAATLATAHIDPNGTGGYIPAGGIVGAPLAVNSTVFPGLPAGTTDVYVENYYDSTYALSGSPTNYGQWRETSSADLPPRATQWTDTPQFIFPLCRFVFCNWNPSSGVVDPNLGVYVSKYAESSVRLPSADHSRPQGTDRLIETAAGTCSAGVWTPTGLRFPTCPPMAGRLAVLSIVDNLDGTLTVTTEAAPLALDAPLDFCKNDMTPLKTNVTPTASSTTVFKVTAAIADVAAAKWVCLYGALPTDPAQSGVAHWYWADTRGKGNFVVGSWILDARTVGEAARIWNPDGTPKVVNCAGGNLTGTPYFTSGGAVVHNPDTTVNYGYGMCVFTDECKGYIACAPWMIVTSGNASDTPPAGMGVRYDFASIVNFDEAYGSGQWLEIVQAMTDPLYSAVPSTAQNECDGSALPTCTPLVEARCQMPYAYAIMIVPPDNGANWGQNEPAPSGGDFADYTWKSPQTNQYGVVANVILPPAVGDNTIFDQCPDGYSPTCCNQGTNPRCP